MTEPLQAFILQVQEEAPFILEERRAALETLSDLIHQQRAFKGSAELLFVCTHNSRRSQFAQVWAQFFAKANGLEDVTCYSGGTETTAVYPSTIAAIERAGLPFEVSEAEVNPEYWLEFAEGMGSIKLFSKSYDHASNPRVGFTAIMTCSEADEACPAIAGALIRVPLTYEDPKETDGTPDEEEAYDETCLIIASEMYYVMSQL
jgi:arsenate reductase